MDLELRCPNVMHGIIRVKDNFLEVKCRHWRCKNREKNKVVLHYYDLNSGELVKTIEYKDPVIKDVDSGAARQNREESNVNSVA
jgi:hypothetical protein